MHIYIGIDYYDKDDNRYVGPLIESEYIYGKMELKKALNSRFQIQVQSSNILKFS